MYQPKMKYLSLSWMFLILTMNASAQSLTPPMAATGSPVPLWPAGKVPEARGVNPDNDVPTLTPYLPAPEKASGASMVICPGGGYGSLAGHEGEAYARWLNEYGVAGFVLKYRLGSHGYRHPAMMHDAQRAIRLVRAHAAEWKLDPARIGIIGSSAGGHLAATVLTHFDTGKPDAPDPIERQSCRPDLGVLCYAVITMGKDTEGGTRGNLLGSDPAPDLVNDLSNEKQVRADTPPCFIWHTWEDQIVKVENALTFAEALRAKGVHYELHIYEKGGHGMGLGGGNAPGGYHRWTADLLAWLGERGWLARR